MMDDDDDLLRKAADELGITVEDVKRMVRPFLELREKAQLELSVSDEEWNEVIDDLQQTIDEAEAFGLDLMTYIEMSGAEGRA